MIKIDNMSENIKLSICVPIYGTEKYIERCARSLFEQTYDNIEFIFVNDCTKDDSINILRQTINDYPKLASKIKIIEHEKNLGLAGARLTGLQRASGDYVWCVDSDDYIDNHAIEQVLPYMLKAYDLIVFNYYVDDGKSLMKFSSKKLNVDNLLVNHIPPSIWKCIVRKSLYFEYKILPVIGIDSSEDYLLTARLILIARKKVLLNDKFLYYYNVSNLNSYMNNMKISNYENSVDSAIIVLDFYKKQHALQTHRNALAFRLAMCYVRLKNVDSNNSKCHQLAIILKALNKCYFYVANMSLRLPVRIKALKFLYLINERL